MRLFVQRHRDAVDDAAGHLAVRQLLIENASGAVRPPRGRRGPNARTRASQATHGPSHDAHPLRVRIDKPVDQFWTHWSSESDPGRLVVISVDPHAMIGAGVGLLDNHTRR